MALRNMGMQVHAYFQSTTIQIVCNASFKLYQRVYPKTSFKLYQRVRHLARWESGQTFEKLFAWRGESTGMGDQSVCSLLGSRSDPVSVSPNFFNWRPSGPLGPSFGGPVGPLSLSIEGPRAPLSP
jgi:hypothetical protein